MEMTFNEVALAAFLFGIAAMLFVYGMSAPYTQPGDENLEGSDEAWAIDYERDMRLRNKDSLFEKLIRPAIRNFIPQSPMAANIKGSKREKTILLLISSGNPWRLSPEEYIGALWLGGLAGGITGLAVAVPLGFSPVVLGLLSAAIGALIPRWWYRRARSARIDEANRSLPEGIDLLRIVMVSGQKFQSAIVEVSRRLPPGLIKNEFMRIADDLRSGRPLDKSMADFSVRVPAESVESFTRAIIQGERLGAEISETLENQSESIRRSYEARIDKAIAALETTVFLPILLGLVPAIFIIITAPALTAITTYL